MPVKIASDEVYLARLLARSWIAPGNCRIWLGAKKPTGYGNMAFRGRVELAHKVAYILAYGPVPAGCYVCHRCDTPGCVQASHLFAGTPLANQVDMRQKGRARKHRKFDDAEIAEVVRARRSGETLRSLSVRFGISQAHVSRLASGKSSRTRAAFAVTELGVVFEEAP